MTSAPRTGRWVIGLRVIGLRVIGLRVIGLWVIGLWVIGSSLSPTTGSAAPRSDASRSRARPAPPPGRAAPAQPGRRADPRRPPTRGPRARVSTGEYGGVTPGLPRMPRIRLPRNARRHCYLTWTGFQLTPRGSRLFLQFNRRPAYKLLHHDGRLVLALPGCRVGHWNNLRPLVTRYFDTPVLRADVRRRRRGKLRFRIRLRRPIKPRIQVVQLQQWYYLFVTFRHPHRSPLRVRRGARPAAKPDSGRTRPRRRPKRQPARRRPATGPTPP
jgi:hypothetical protein